MGSQLIPILGFAPDVDPTTPGVLTACEAKIPTISGMKAAPSAVEIGMPALADQPTGAAAVVLLDGTNRFFAGTADALYERAGATWDDVSGSTYNAGSARWRFAQYGNVSLAVQVGDPIQYSNGSGAFADISGAPSAAVIETVGQFVMVANYNGIENGVKWCAIGDYTDWVDDTATQAGSLTLTSSPGEITALRRLGENVVVYKKRAMYLGSYEGTPYLWTFKEISNTAGALSHEFVIPIVTKEGGAAHIFGGADNFYYFDGSRPVPIGNPLKDWFFSNLGDSFTDKCANLHDPINSTIRFFYPDISSTIGELNAAVVYNYRANPARWGIDDRDVAIPVEYISSGLTYSDLEAYGTYADLPVIPYGSPFWYEGTNYPAYFDGSFVLQGLSGVAGNSSMTTGDIGDDMQVTLFSRARLRYRVAPTSGAMTNYHRMSLGDSLTTGSSSALSSGKYDVLQSARWHRAKFDEVGDTEATAIHVEFETDGLE